MKTKNNTIVVSFREAQKKAYAFFLLFVCLFIAGSGSASAAEDIAVAKDNITVNVSTVDHGDWYDDRCTNKIDDDGDGAIDGADRKAPVCDGGETGIKPEVICDASSSESDGYLKIAGALPTDLDMAPCNRDGVHDDYYSTSTSNEMYVQPSEKNFTFRVSASDPSGIDAIKIEWISGASRSREAGSYWNPAKLIDYQKIDTALNPHKSSFTCKGVGVCEICVMGGTCANPVIPTADFSADGMQQIILFRAVITDGAMNSIATGFDDSSDAPVLDRFYRFVICSTNCHTSSDCENHVPEAELVGAEHGDFCSNPLYTLRWKFKDKDSGDRPSTYAIEVRNHDIPSVVYSAVRSAGEVKCKVSGCAPCGTDEGVECDMSAILFNGFLEGPDGKSVNIEFGNKTYDWRVKVYDNSSEKNCIGVSEWTGWSSETSPSLSFTTPYSIPSVSFTMTNEDGEDCSKGNCLGTDKISFKSTTKSDPRAGTLSYEWFVDNPVSVYSTENSFSNIFNDDSTHKIRLAVADGQGISCFSETSLDLRSTGDPEGPDEPEDDENAGWNEIAPGRTY